MNNDFIHQFKQSKHEQKNQNNHEIVFVTNHSNYTKSKVFMARNITYSQTLLQINSVVHRLENSEPMDNITYKSLF